MSDIAVFSDRYEIDREIGSGGMARVFLAMDLKYDRPVAIKILRPELSSGIGRSRFMREIMIAARLSHPHILPLFDSGEADGILFFVMPFVSGPSLRSRLMQEGKLSISEAIDITRAVAAALDYAHGEDVVHRDIKPENIMIHNNVAMVTDFGIGKALTQAGGDNLTQAGVMIGTPSYMSPEQISGDPDIDGRSDIYSLACVLFEMVSGEKPFKANTPEASLSARFTKPPPDASVLDSAVPGNIAQAIAQALSPERDKRFSTAAEFADALHAPTRGAAPSRSANTNSSPSVAVLPFANMSSDPENEYFSDGITDEIINALMQLKHLHVAARTSSFSFKGKQTDISDVGAQLNVANVLEGSVRRAGSRVRITAQLISVADGYNVWSERYDREFDDVFEIQDEIASTIADRLKVALTESKEILPVKRPTDDMEAYQLYLKGRYLWNRRTVDGLKTAVTLFQKAVDLDPNFALAHAGLADAYLLLGSYMVIAREEANHKAKQAARKALELDDSLAEAHTSLGQALRWDLDWEGEEREYRRAISLNPNYATAHQWYGGLLNALGKTEEALAELRTAERLDPLSHAISSTLALVLIHARRYEEALDQLERTVELAPDFLSARALLGLVYSKLGRREAALAELEQLLGIRSDHPYTDLHRALVYHGLGDHDVVMKYLNDGKETADPGLVGTVYAAIGDADNAFAYLNRAIDERTLTMLINLKVDPNFDTIRTDPRFPELLKRMGLPGTEST